MKTVMVRYKVKPDRVAENEALITKVFEQLKTEAPDKLRYQTYKLDDGLSFMHIALVPHEGPNPLTEISAFKDFVSNVKDRCDELPVTTVISGVGYYSAK
jgi:hypothetical protein